MKDANAQITHWYLALQPGKAPRPKLGDGGMWRVVYDSAAGEGVEQWVHETVSGEPGRNS